MLFSFSPRLLWMDVVIRKKTRKLFLAGKIKKLG
jgi:hypothetical protein